jgi:hypothetical protein
VPHGGDDDRPGRSAHAVVQTRREQHRLVEHRLDARRMLDGVARIGVLDFHQDPPTTMDLA